jgi:predicted amidohydrolase
MYNPTMRLYLPRFYVRGLAENLAAMHRDIADAAARECDVVHFPEQFLTAYLGEGDAREFRLEFAHQSARFPKILMMLGTISEDGVNRQYVYRGGEVRASYDKVHLFLPNGEGEMWRPGSCYAALEYGEWRIGLCTCNDVRFPEQARALKLKYDINMLVYPSLWPWQRDHVLAALLRARAIENGCFSAGCCVAGVDNGKELFDGAGNHVFDPLGNEIQAQDRVYALDPALLAQVTVDTRAQYIAIDETRLFKG